MSISQDWITNELEDTELEALHRSPSVEYSFYNAVRAGDMEAVNKNCEEDSFLHLKGTGIISSQRFLHSENGFLHHCTPDCRSASYYGQRFYRKNDPPEKKLYSFQTGHAMRGLYLRSH